MNKRQYAVVLTLAVVAGLLGGVVSNQFFMGTPVFTQKTEVAEVIRAKSFEVVDEDGQARAVLTLVNGEPGLWLTDQNEKRRAVLGLLKNGEPGLWLYDQNEKRRAQLRLLDGEPRLQLYDQNGKGRATLGHTDLNITRTGSIEKRPASSLVLFDKDGKVIWSVP